MDLQTTLVKSAWACSNAFQDNLEKLNGLTVILLKPSFFSHLRNQLTRFFGRGSGAAWPGTSVALP